MNFWLVVFLTLFWIISTDAYEKDHNFVDAFNTIICGLVVVGYIGICLFK